MSNPPYPSSSDPSFHEPSLKSSNVTKYADLERTVQDTRVENTRLDSDIQQLRGRTMSIIGLLIGLLLLTIGGFAWLAISLLNLEKEELQRANGIDPAIVNQVEQLEKQVNNLSKPLPGNLTDTLQSNQTTLAQLQTQLQQVTTQIKALEKSPNSVQPQSNTPPQTTPSSNQPSSESPQPANSP